MDLLFIGVVLYVGLVLTIYFYWNYRSNKNNNWLRNHKQLNDIRYYELKSKNEFLVAVSVLLIAIIAFFGYSTKQNLQDSLRTEFKDSISNLNDSLKNLNQNLNLSKNETLELINKIDASRNNIDGLQNYQTELTSKLANTGQNIKDVNKFISEIKSKNILKKPFYVIDSIRIDNINSSIKDPLTKKEFVKFVVIEFDKLVTTDKDKLPIFKTPPIIIPVNIDGMPVIVYDVTTKGCKLTGDVTGVSNNLDNPERYEFALNRLIFLERN